MTMKQEIERIEKHIEQIHAITESLKNLPEFAYYDNDEDTRYTFAEFPEISALTQEKAEIDLMELIMAMPGVAAIDKSWSKNSTSITAVIRVLNINEDLDYRKIDIIERTYTVIKEVV